MRNRFNYLGYLNNLLTFNFRRLNRWLYCILFVGNLLYNLLWFMLIFLREIQISIHQIFWFLLMWSILYWIITKIILNVLVFNVSMKVFINFLNISIFKLLKLVSNITTLWKTFFMNFRKLFMRVYHNLIISWKMNFCVLFIRFIRSYNLAYQLKLTRISRFLTNISEWRKLLF
jgi:hypothetical protein